MLPPGRARLAATPSATGSALLATMTSGMLFVALRAASSGAGPTIRITSARRRTSPATASGSKPSRPRTSGRSMTTLRPSMYPCSRSPAMSAACCGLESSGRRIVRTPMRSCLPSVGGWAASGRDARHALSPARKARRYMLATR